MAENKQNPAAEPLQKGAQAANMVRGAVKAGKAIAGAAKGAAAGGPYGGIIAFAWENRKLIAKITISATALILIPIIMLCMLPSVIFGGVNDAYSEIDPDNPILNSSISITESTNAICQSVDGILSEALNGVIFSIQTDFGKSSADQIDIINPYASQITFDATRLVSMYCASKEDYTAISIADLEQLLRGYKNQLFSYSWKEETRTVMTTDPETGALVPLTQTNEETGEETVVTEVWRIYTVAYHGDSIFSEQVFSLSDEQIELANNYASNLNLFLQDERFSGSVNSAFMKNTAISTAGYTDPSTKNNLDLVRWAIQAEQNHWGYVWGTFGSVFTTSLYEYKLQQYPEEIGAYSDFILANWLGGRTADCVGLIKGYGWLNEDTLEINYGTNGMPDIGADSMYYNASEKGSIGTIPEIPGLAVWHAGHIGIYIGNGVVIEAKGTKFGVIRSNLADGNWTHWLKIPYITYL